MKARRVLILLISVLLAGQIALAAQTATLPPRDIKPALSTFEDLQAAIEQARTAVLADPRNAGAWTDLARLLIKNGTIAEAEGALRAGLAADSKYLPSLVALGRLYRSEYRFDEAFALLETAKAVDPTDPNARLLDAALLLDRMDFPAADAIYAALEAEHPRMPEALCGRAETAYWENRYDDALAWIGKCLKADPAYSRAHLFESLIHRIRQENDLWAAAGRKAVAGDPFDADARANLSNILMRGEHKSDEGYAEAKIALRIDPFNFPAHNYIGNGWTAKVYPDTVYPVEALLGEADAALLQRDYAAAGEKFHQVLELAPGTIPAMLGLGTIAYHKKDFAEARRRFAGILALDPDYGLAHYGLAQSLLRTKDRINVRFADIEKTFAAKDTPEPPYLRNVFINYAGLDADLQKIIRLSVRPLRGMLKTAREKGATFYITPFHKKQSEAPHMADIRGERTFDGRLWDDVKGLGGENALSGEDWERDVKYLRFNVVAHEFAHQVHRLLPQAVQDEIDRLYAKAKAERLTLDFYSDANVMEYFAVGVEAYVSEDKLADQKIAYGHTRGELLKRDPDLFRLIERLEASDTID